MTDGKVFYGEVVWFKSFGFIKPEGADQNTADVFVHYSDVVAEQGSFRMLQKGQKVSYEIGFNNRGQPKAVNVCVIK